MVCNLLSSPQLRCTTYEKPFVIILNSPTAQEKKTTTTSNGSVNFISESLCSCVLQGPKHIDQRVEAFLSKFESEIRQLTEDEFKVS